MNGDYLLKGRLSVLKEMGGVLILVLAVFASVWYAFWIEGKNTQTFEVLYTWLTQDYMSMNLMSFGYIVIKYLKKVFLIWLFGWFGLTAPLSWVLLFSMIFSYGFTTTALILLFGGRGIMIGMFSYGVQAILAVSIGIEILKSSMDLIGNARGQVKKQYVKLLIPILLVSGIMASLDLGIINNVKILIK